MRWSDTLIKGLAIAITPVKLVSKGIDHTKQEVKDTLDKFKMLGILAFILFMFAVFFTVAIAQVINHFAENNYLGFIVVSFLYLLTAVIIFMIYRKKQK